MSGNRYLTAGTNLSISLEKFKYKWNAITVRLLYLKYISENMPNEEPLIPCIFLMILVHASLSYCHLDLY